MMAEKGLLRFRQRMSLLMNGYLSEGVQENCVVLVDESIATIDAGKLQQQDIGEADVSVITDNPEESGAHNSPRNR